MNTIEGARRPDAVESLVAGIKTEVEFLIQDEHAFQEQERKSLQKDLDPKILNKFFGLPVNPAQITDVKMQVSVTNEETTLLKMERKGKEAKTFTDKEPRTTYFYLNFKDKQKPHIIFIYSLELRDGQTSRAYITQKNTKVSDKDIGKPSIRASVVSDLTAVRDLLRDLNKKTELTQDQ